MEDEQVKEPEEEKVVISQIADFNERKQAILDSMEDHGDAVKEDEDEVFLASLEEDDEDDSEDDEENDEESSEDADTSDEDVDESDEDVDESAEDLEDKKEELDSKILEAVQKEQEKRDTALSAKADAEELKSHKELWEKFNKDPFAVMESLVPDAWNKYNEYKNSQHDWSNLSAEQKQVIELKKELELVKAQISDKKESKEIKSDVVEGPTPELQKAIDTYVEEVTKFSEVDKYDKLKQYCKAKEINLIEEVSAFAGRYMEQNENYMSPSEALDSVNDFVLKELGVAEKLLSGKEEAPKKDKKKKHTSTLTNKGQVSGTSKKAKPKKEDTSRKARQKRAMAKLKLIDERNQNKI